jgi:uncharacterized protein (DUF924 family)
MGYTSVYDFWFKELTPKQWFDKSDNLDKKIQENFIDLHKRSAAGELKSWRESAKGALSEIILLDQFSRNIFRDKKEAFQCDELAIECAKASIQKKQDLELNNTEKSFLYMPFMHSESLEIHEEAIKLFSIEGLENNYKFELEHKKIIQRFGRYPHRNIILGRKSTQDEIDFLRQPGSSF